MKQLTVFTPTYNRAYILPKLYESLCNQTCADFVWSIVDDGSTDETELLVSKWIQDGKIEIIYEKQPNGGKMRAHNRGVLKCDTELFLCVDSDDYLEEDSVEISIELWNSTGNKEGLSGIVAYRLIKNLDETDYKIIKTFPRKERSSLHSLYADGFMGDTSLVFNSNVLKKYLFPEIDGEKFITEAYVYDQIDQSYEFLICDKPMIVCSYQTDGYTQGALKLKRDNPKGWALFYNQRARLYLEPFSNNIKHLMYYIIFSRLSGCPNSYRNSSNKGLRYIMAFILSFRYQRKLLRRFNGLK